MPWKIELMFVFTWSMLQVEATSGTFSTSILNSTALRSSFSAYHQTSWGRYSFAYPGHLSILEMGSSVSTFMMPEHKELLPSTVTMPQNSASPTSKSSPLPQAASPPESTREKPLRLKLRTSRSSTPSLLVRRKMPPKKLKAIQPRRQKGPRITLHPPLHPVMGGQWKQRPSPLNQVETVTRENSPLDQVGIITVPETTANQVERVVMNTQPVEEFSGSIREKSLVDRVENVSSEISLLDNPNTSTHDQLAARMIEDVASDPSPLEHPSISPLQQSPEDSATPSPLNQQKPIQCEEAPMNEAKDLIFRLAQVCKVQTINNSKDVLSQSDTNIQNPAPALFTLFPKLDLLLRQRIWAHALPGPRVVDIRRYWLPPKIHGYLTTTAPPTILHVNRESRSVALQHYALSFCAKMSPSHTYFNFATDTLFLDASVLEDSLNSFVELFGYSADIARVERVAYPENYDVYKDGVDCGKGGFMRADRLMKLKGVREVVLTNPLMGPRGKELVIEVTKDDFMKGFEEEMGVKVKFSRGIIGVKA
jgi:hypothetical protein